MKEFKDKEEMVAQLRPAIAEEFELEESDIVPDAPIKETLELDSLNLVDLIVLIEKVAGVKAKGTDVSKITTFEALYDFVWNLRGLPAAS